MASRLSLRRFPQRFRFRTNCEIITPQSFGLDVGVAYPGVACELERDVSSSVSFRKQDREVQVASEAHSNAFRVEEGPSHSGHHVRAQCAAGPLRSSRCSLQASSAPDHLGRPFVALWRHRLKDVQSPIGYGHSKEAGERRCFLGGRVISRPELCSGALLWGKCLSHVVFVSIHFGSRVSVWAPCEPSLELGSCPSPLAASCCSFSARASNSSILASMFVN